MTETLSGSHGGPAVFDEPPIGRYAAGAVELPSSSGQEQLWFIDRFHDGLAAHNSPYLVRLRGRLDVAALGRALDGVLARHETLRTRLVADEDGRPVQVVDPPESVTVDVIDESGAGRAVAAERFARMAAAEVLRPFDVGHDRLIRWRLTRLAAEEHLLLIVVHQAVFDDDSFGVLFAELTACYRAEVTGAPSGLSELPARFADYAVWERDRLRGEACAELEEYWRTGLSGYETLRVPTDRVRPLLASHDGAVESVRTDAALLAGLCELGRESATSVADTVLAALTVLLSRYTGQTDIMVGTVGAHRGRSELAPLIAPLANPLPIRTDLSGDPTFGELLGRVRAATGGARAHQDLPFARLVEIVEVERDTSRAPVFQVGFAYRRPVADVTAAGVVFHQEHIELPAAKYDLNVTAEPGPDGLCLEITYPPVLFDAGTVRRMLGHLEVVLRGVVADPSRRVSELPVLTEAELRRELVEWNDTAVEFAPVCIHQGFEDQARRAPDAVAAQYEDESWSYTDLNSRANRIARWLRGMGVGPESLVGVCMGTGLRRLAVLLGVWKAGGGYVPLDASLPAERLSFMVSDTGMSVLVTDDQSQGRVPTCDAVRVVSVDDDWPVIEGFDGADLTDVGVTRSNVAYVIYTSGSTGEPKGVVVEHRQAINFLQGMVEHWRIGSGDAVLQFAAYTFDVSVMDMFMPLLGGARVVLASPETLHSPPRLAALMRERRVTFSCLPPAVLTLLVGEEFPDLRLLLSAGEELSSELLRAWLRDGLEIYNGYGPTEASIGATFMKLEADTPLPPPIGRPKPNYRVYVLDARLNPVPVGVVGELHIGGVGVARGYLNRPELTGQRFIEDPFVSGGRLYKTGDLVRRRADGTIVFVGRADTQVKIRGLRVELGEIEATLTAHPAVAQAVVTVRADDAGGKQLVGYVRPSDGALVDVADVRARLTQQLPGYMVPARLVVLEEFPLTAHGKVDKAALPAPQTVHNGVERVPPATLMETLLVDVYARVLGAGQVGASDSFFDLGGNSLQAMRLITELRRDLAVDLDVAAVFLAPTPRQMAAVLCDQHGFHDTALDPEDLDQLAGEQSGTAMSSTD